MLLIHISDIHFRLDEIGTAMDPNHHLRNVLLRDAKNMCDRLGATPDLLAISGDIAYAGNKQEYDFALQWLEKFCKQCGLKKENIFVIPGNHDVVRSIASREGIQMLHRDIKATCNISLNDKNLAALKKQPLKKNSNKKALPICACVITSKMPCKQLNWHWKPIKPIVCWQWQQALVKPVPSLV